MSDRRCRSRSPGPRRLEIRAIDLLDESSPEPQRWLDVHASAQRQLFGERGSSWTLDEVRAFHRTTEKLRVPRAAWLGDRLVGALDVLMPTTDNESLAILWLSVHPTHRGRGAGSALLAEAERIAADHGRTTLTAETEWAVGRTDESERFAATHGFSVGLTMVRSAMSLPADRPALAALAASDEAGYRLESFVDEMPEEWLEDRALLQQRMSTDAPSDDLEVEEESWDADRLRSNYARARSSGRRIVETVARDLVSGRLVGFTSVAVSAGEPTLAYQQDTLVLEEHRGHRLGLRLKAGNALRVMEELADVTAVRTWNAASNSHMLAVNRRLGYVVDGYSRQWQRR